MSQRIRYTVLFALSCLALGFTSNEASAYCFRREVSKDAFDRIELLNLPKAYCFEYITLKTNKDGETYLVLNGTGEDVANGVFRAYVDMHTAGGYVYTSDLFVKRTDAVEARAEFAYRADSKNYFSDVLGIQGVITSKNEKGEVSTSTFIYWPDQDNHH